MERRKKQGGGERRGEVEKYSMCSWWWGWVGRGGCGGRREREGGKMGGRGMEV